jgi:YYY domain-containing protein
MASLMSILIWLAISFTIQILLYPAFATMLPCRRTAYGVSKVFSFTLFSYIVWVASLLTKADTFTVAVCCFVGLLLALLSRFQSSDNYEHLLPNIKDLLHIELLYGSVLVLVWLQYCFHPEIYWGEKPMDFTFLNYFTRITTLPPSDPWASGNSLGYYYLGVYQFGLLHKLSGLSPAIGYNFSLALIAAQYVTTCFLIFRLCCSQRAATICALLVGFLGTYDTWWVLISGFKPLGFDLYWATSRTLHSPGINEYPLWSLLFADLHAHVIALPVVALTILLLVVQLKIFFEEQPSSRRGALRFSMLLALPWGMLVAINSWDYISLGIVVSVGLLLVLGLYPRQWQQVLILGLATLAMSIIYSLPFHLSVKTKTEIGWGFVYPEEFNTFLELFRIHGHFLLLMIIAVIAWMLHRTQFLQTQFKVMQVFLGLVMTLIPLAIGILTAQARGTFDPPYGPLIFATLIAFCGALLTCSSSRGASTIKISGVLIFIAAVLLSLAECFYFMDRMNTLFKVYNVIWGILAIGTLMLTCQVQHLRWARFASWTVLTPAVAASLLLIGIMCRFNRIESTARPSWNGTAYLQTFNPVEQRAFTWLNEHVQGAPILVEAFGPSYQEYTRFAMHTGLPVVLGWEYHVQQRGTRDAQQRKEDIRTIYQEQNMHLTMRALNRYNVSIIVVGKLERNLYGKDVEAKFLNNPAYFKQIFSYAEGDNSISLYTHRYAKSL